MIRRAQAEALLKLAEALEECERNGLTLESDYGEYLKLYKTDEQIAAFKNFNGAELRLAISQLYPKSEVE
jgi:hypothetical protein